MTGNVGSARQRPRRSSISLAPLSTDDKQLIDRVTVDRPYQVNLRVRIAEVSRSCDQGTRNQLGNVIEQARQLRAGPGEWKSGYWHLTRQRPDR